MLFVCTVKWLLFAVTISIEDHTDYGFQILIFVLHNCFFVTDFHHINQLVMSSKW